MAGLGPYLVKRLIQAVITLFVVTSIVWVLFEAMPGDPTDPFYGNPNFKAEDVANMAVAYGLSEKFLVNYTGSDFAISINGFQYAAETMMNTLRLSHNPDTGGPLLKFIRASE